MAASISGISPSKGSPYGGQMVTITGSGFGASGSVTVNGIAAHVVSWSATSVQVTAPRNVDADGVIVLADDVVPVVLTAQDTTTANASYEFSRTRVAVAVEAIAARLRAINVQAGYFHSVGADQVHTLKEDISVDTGSAWPQVQIYFEGGNIPEDQHDSPFDFSKDTVPFVVQAATPVETPQGWYEEALCLASDLRRALMVARDNAGTSDTTAITEWSVGKLSDNASGALAVATVQGFFVCRSIVNDPTSATIYNNLLT